MEQDEAWSTGKRYFDMTAYWQWHAASSATPAPLAAPSGAKGEYDEGQPVSVVGPRAR
jgi:hypothetical protein